MDEKQLEKYWNDKHPQQKIIYSGRSMPKKCPTCGQHSIAERLALDVRNLICAEDHQLKDIVEKNKLVGKNHDETMLKIQKWVCNNFKYIYDDDNQGTIEHWQFPFESLSTRFGDCEDGAILMASLALNAGVPSFRVRVAAGNVKPHEETAPEGGHAYCVYLRESDNIHVVLDWCFYQDPEIEMSKKIPIKDNKVYKEVWFSFNHLYAWSHKSWEIDDRTKNLPDSSETP